MSEEEKTLEEQTETIIDEIETENDVIIEPETEDDVKEAFEINKDDELREALGAPLIRALGDPDPADPNMIRKHLDNFLAMLCGETPVDSNVRTSTEYWLKRLAEGLGGSTKKIYQHTVRITNVSNATYQANFSISIINNDPDAITKTTLVATDQVYSATGNFRILSGSVACPLSAVIVTGSDVYVIGVDMAGSMHNTTLNPLNIATWLEDSNTYISDETIALN